MPRSPRATITPSLASTIPSMFSTASLCSILETTGWSPPACSIASFVFSTSLRSLTKDAANQSQSGTPNSIPLRSASVGGLTERSAPGAFTPFRLETSPPETTLPRNPSMSPSIEVTITSMRPSSMKRLPPTPTSLGKSL